MDLQEAIVPAPITPPIIIDWDGPSENYLDWLSIPMQFRGDGIPRDEKDYSNQFGISRIELRALRAVPGFLTELKRRQRKWMDRQDHSINGAIVQSALLLGKEGFQDRKLYKQLKGDLVDRVQIKQDITVRNADGQSRNETIGNIEAILGKVKGAINQEYDRLAKEQGVLIEGEGFTVIEEPVSEPTEEDRREWAALSQEGRDETWEEAHPEEDSADE